MTPAPLWMTIFVQSVLVAALNVMQQKQQLPLRRLPPQPQQRIVSTGLIKKANLGKKKELLKLMQTLL